MSYFRTVKNTIRKSFSKIKGVVPVPNLIEIQSASFNDFVQLDYLPEERENTETVKVLQGVFPEGDESALSLE